MAWESWAFELPLLLSDMGHHYPVQSLYVSLNDPVFLSSMAKQCREKLLISLCAHSFSGIILLSGGKDTSHELYDADTDIAEFRQESYFRYLFGFNEPNALGAVDVKTGEAILFVEEQSVASQRWNGNLRPLSFFKEKYGVEQVYYTHQLNEVLKKYEIVHTLYGLNTDSGNHTKTCADELYKIDHSNINRSLLFPVLSECRVQKTELELVHLRNSCLLSSMAHVYVMRHCRPGMIERQLEAMFQSFCRFCGGCRHMSYTCICGTGCNGAILHYGHAGAPNDHVLNDGDMMVLDMGAEFSGYSTDITLSYPSNGKFTEIQKVVYNAVYDAQVSVEAIMKPGVMWPEMHQLAERVILKHLKDFGLLTGDIEEMMQAYVGAIFMPHGLGHLLGLNVHDVGGFNGCERLKGPGIQYLRTTRQLLEGMVLTVEPGCYFNDPILDDALANENQRKFINLDKLALFRGFGGVRLEDDVVVTATGIENLTIVPRKWQDIEKVMETARALGKH